LDNQSEEDKEGYAKAEEMIETCVIYADYLIRDKQPPSLNKLLDYRLRLVELKESPKYPIVWYEDEIKAVDQIIKENYK